LAKVSETIFLSVLWLKFDRRDIAAVAITLFYKYNCMSKYALFLAA
jgi:hypothetical protein